MKRIIVNLRVEGTHLWESCKIEEVLYLSNLHRHMFYIRLEKEVIHNDRDIEIIKLKHDIKDYLKDRYYDKDLRTHCFCGRSCEDIAEDLSVVFDAYSVEVLEDNENGAIIIK